MEFWETGTRAEARVYTPAEAECVFSGTDPLLERFTFNSRSDIACRSAGLEK